MRATSNVNRGRGTRAQQRNPGLNGSISSSNEIDELHTAGPHNLIPLSPEHKRLPVYEGCPSLYEKVAFGTLHLVAIVVIGLTAYDSLRFAMLTNSTGPTEGSSELIAARGLTNAPGRAGAGPQRGAEQTAGLPPVQPPKS